MQPGISQRMIELARSMRAPAARLAALFLAFMPLHAQAQVATSSSCGTYWWRHPFDCLVVNAVGGAIGIVVNILTFLLFILSVFFGWVVSMVVRFMKPFILESNRITQIEQISAMWSNVRDLANALLILVLLVAAILVIVRYEKGNYTIKQVLPKVVTAVLLINFSKLIIQVIVDFFHVAATGMYQLLAGGVTVGTDAKPFTEENALSGLFDGMRIPDLLTTIQESSVIVGSSGKESFLTNTQLLIASFLIVVLMFVIVVSAVSVLILYVARIVALGLLTIISPLAILASVLPQTKQYADKFWKEVIKYASFPLILAAFFSFAVRINSLFIDVGNTVNEGKAFDTEMAGLPKIQWATLINIIIVTMIIKEGVKQAKSGSFAEAAVTATENTMNKYGKLAAQKAPIVPGMKLTEKGLRPTFYSADNYKAIGANMKKNVVERLNEHEELKNLEGTRAAFTVGEKVGVGDYRLSKKGSADKVKGQILSNAEKSAKEKYSTFTNTEFKAELDKLNKGKIDGLEDIANRKAFLSEVVENKLKLIKDSGAQSDLYKLADQLNAKALDSKGEYADQGLGEFVSDQLKKASKRDTYYTTEYDTTKLASKVVGGKLDRKGNFEGARKLTTRDLLDTASTLDGKDIADAIMRNLIQEPVVASFMRNPEQYANIGNSGAIGQALALKGTGYKQLVAGLPTMATFGFTSNKFVSPSVDYESDPEELLKARMREGNANVSLGRFMTGGKHAAVDLGDAAFTSIDPDFAKKNAIYLRPMDPNETDPEKIEEQRLYRERITAAVGDLYRGTLDRKNEQITKELAGVQSEIKTTTNAAALAELEERAKGLEDEMLDEDGIEREVNAVVTRMRNDKDGIILINKGRGGKYMEDGKNAHPIHLMHHENSHALLDAMGGQETLASFFRANLGEAEQQALIAQTREITKAVDMSENQIIEEIFAEGLANERSHSVSDSALRVKLPPGLLDKLKRALDARLKQDVAANTRSAQSAADLLAASLGKSAARQLDEAQRSAGAERSAADAAVPQPSQSDIPNT